jgi:hypothetical protein
LCCSVRDALAYDGAAARANEIDVAVDRYLLVGLETFVVLASNWLRLRDERALVHGVVDVRRDAPVLSEGVVAHKNQSLA